jgi:hypothetical protein
MKLTLAPMKDTTVRAIELVLIICTFIIPLIFNHPYRINLYLAWEGAYRISNGEIPFRDFGLPLGYIFWLVIALFFKIFGPFVYTLLIAQSIINLIANLLFRKLLKQFSVPSYIRLFALTVFLFSFSLNNIWPWYNHLVFVIELGAFVMICNQILKPAADRSASKILIAALLVAATFMTKQDTGGIAFLSSLIILGFDLFFHRTKKTFLLFLLGYFMSLAVMIVPFLQYDFLYWFNLGQFPHNARTNKFDIINEFLGASSWIKFYAMVIMGILLANYKMFTIDFRNHSKDFFFTLVTILILFQAAIIQVTSYTPINGNIYFHSFVFAFAGSFLLKDKIFSSWIGVGAFVLMVSLWWSGYFWTRFFKTRFEGILGGSSTTEVISKNSYIISTDSTDMGRKDWVVSSFKSLKKIKIPRETERGIEELAALDILSKNPKVLNMSELTSLAYDLNFKLDTGSNYPLWFHRNVAFFDREVESFCNRIDTKQYDLILFQDIPELNNFYPYEVQECIKQNYTLKFKFLAPRIPNTSYIEVYIKN